MRTKVFGIVVGVVVLHVVLMFAMVGTSGCANESVMAQRQSLPPVPDNPAPMTAFQSMPAAPAPMVAQPAAPAAQTTDVAALPKLDLGNLPQGPAKAAATGPAAATYKVVSGDTLGGIAQRYGVKTADLAAYNGLDLKSTIRVGQAIQIPQGGKVKAADVAKAAPATGSKSAATGTAATAATAPVAAGGTYVVVKGDYPEKIAKKMKVSTKDLLAANKLTEKSVLQIGQKLVVPGKGAAVAAPAGTTTVVPVQTVKVNVDELDDVLNTLPDATTAPTLAPPLVPANGTSASTVEPVTPPTAPANTNVELDPVMIDRDLPLKDFALRYGVTEEVIRRHNPNAVPADGILKQKTIIMLPLVAN